MDGAVDGAADERVPHRKAFAGEVILRRADVALADLEGVVAAEHRGAAGEQQAQAAGVGLEADERAESEGKPVSANIAGWAIALSGEMVESGSIRCSRPPSFSSGS